MIFFWRLDLNFSNFFFALAEISSLHPLILPRWGYTSFVTSLQARWNYFTHFEHCTASGFSATLVVHFPHLWANVLVHVQDAFYLKLFNKSIVTQSQSCVKSEYSLGSLNRKKVMVTRYRSKSVAPELYLHPLSCNPCILSQKYLKI